MAATEVFCWDNLLDGERYKKMIIWAAKLAEGKSGQVFRKELRDSLFPMAKEKAGKDKKQVMAAIFIMSFVQNIIIEVVSGKKRFLGDEAEKFINESIFIHIFEPDEKNAALEKRAGGIPGDSQFYKNMDFSAENFARAIIATRQIIDEL